MYDTLRYIHDTLTIRVSSQEIALLEKEISDLRAAMTEASEMRTAENAVRRTAQLARRLSCLKTSAWVQSRPLPGDTAAYRLLKELGKPPERVSVAHALHNADLSKQDCCSI